MNRQKHTYILNVIDFEVVAITWYSCCFFPHCALKFVTSDENINIPANFLGGIDSCQYSYVAEIIGQRDENNLGSIHARQAIFSRASIFSVIRYELMNEIRISWDTFIRNLYMTQAYRCRFEQFFIFTEKLFNLAGVPLLHAQRLQDFWNLSRHFSPPVCCRYDLMCLRYELRTFELFWQKRRIYSLCNVSE